MSKFHLGTVDNNSLTVRYSPSVPVRRTVGLIPSGGPYG